MTIGYGLVRWNGIGTRESGFGAAHPVDVKPLVHFRYYNSSRSR
jgi:hypothetical protein